MSCLAAYRNAPPRRSTRSSVSWAPSNSGKSKLPRIKSLKWCGGSKRKVKLTWTTSRRTNMPPLLERIHFPQSLREVQLRAVATPPGSEHDQAEYERGRQEGEKALREELLRQRTELLEAQNGVLASLRQALPQVVRECETGLVALAIEVAQKLVSGLPISHEMVEANLREALAQ